jgi:hypothetical protein
MDLSLGKIIKKKLALFENEINLHSTIIDEDVHWPGFGVFNVRVLANYGFLILYVQFICV